MAGAYAHFVSGYKPDVRAVILALQRLEGGHSGQEVGCLIAKLVKSWNLENAVSMFVADNADLNDVAVKQVIQELALPLVGKRRSRYLGRIINLAAKAFLFSIDVEGFEARNATNFALELSAARKAQAEWRKKGPVGKLHNLVIYIRSLTLWREAFKRKQVDVVESDISINSKSISKVL